MLIPRHLTKARYHESKTKAPTVSPTDIKLDNKAIPSIVIPPSPLPRRSTADSVETGSEKAEDSDEPSSQEKRTKLTWRDKMKPGYWLARVQIMGSELKEKASDPEKKKKNTRLAVGAIALVAVGLVVAYGANKNWFSGDELSHGGSPLDPNRDSVSPANEFSGMSGGGGYVTKYSHEALTAQKGEGWYQTLNELGISNSSERAEVLKTAGPDLVRMGVAYPDPSIGGFGIRRSGEMPHGALDLLRNTAKAKGFAVK